MKILFTIASCLIMGAALGQVPTLGADILPRPGDVISYETAADVGLLNLDATGVGNVWEFDWTADGTATESYLEVSAGNGAASFPSANLLLRRGVTETYLRNDGSQIFAVGEFTFVELLGTEVPVPYLPEFEQFRTPMTIGTTFSSSSTNNYGIAGSDLPPALTDSLPIQLDSVRLLSTYEKQVTAVAAGTLTVGEMESVPVLLVKDTTTTSVTIEAKVPIIGWVDLSTFMMLPGTGQDIGSVSYDFYTEAVVGPLLSVTPNDALGNSAQWQTLVITSTDNPEQEKPTAGFLQNPSPDMGVFQWTHIPQGTYSLEVITSDGRQVVQQAVEVQGTTGTVTVDLSAVRGALVYHFYNIDQKQSWTGKLIR